MQLYLILSVLLATFMHITAILRGQVVHSLQRCTEKNCSTAHGHSVICFDAICLFCGIFRRYLRKELQSVALASDSAVWFRSHTVRHGFNSTFSALFFLGCHLPNIYVLSII